MTSGLDAETLGQNWVLVAGFLSLVSASREKLWIFHLARKPLAHKGSIGTPGTT